MSQPNITAHVNNSFTFSKLAYYNPSVPIVPCHFLTGIALDDVDLHFSLMVWKTDATEEETTPATWLYHQRNQSMHVTDGVTVRSLSASLLKKLSVATGCLSNCVNWKLSCKFKSGVHFQVTLKQNHGKEMTENETTCLYLNKTFMSCFQVDNNVRKHLCRLTNASFMKLAMNMTG